MQMNDHTLNTIYDINWNNVSGPVTIPLTNDYLFHMTLQTNRVALQGLLCSLLRLESSQIVSLEILNPIELGKSMDEKTYILDIRLLFNDHTSINIEMQITNEHNWTDRSLLYFCRTFDNINAGEDYVTVKSAIQISLLNFTLFPDAPEFYATYRIMNERSHQIYSDKIRLSVVDLTNIELATEEDKACGLDCWAAFFRATTWEEIKMLAETNPEIKEASATVYKLSQDEKIRMQCEAREEYFRRMRTEQRVREMLSQENEALGKKNEVLGQQNMQLTHENSQLLQQKEQLTQQKEQLTQQKEQLTQQKKQLTQQTEQLTQQTEQLTQQTEQLTQRTEQLTQQKEQLTQQLADKDTQIQRLRQKIIALGLDPDKDANV